jgi:hypothetical protein
LPVDADRDMLGAASRPVQFGAGLLTPPSSASAAGRRTSGPPPKGAMAGYEQALVDRRLEDIVAEVEKL